jgi:hypothetical protein
MWLLVFLGAAVLPSVYAEHDEETGGLHGVDNCLPSWNLVGNITHNDVLQTPCVPNPNGSGCRHGERVAMNQAGTHIAMSAPDARDPEDPTKVVGYVAVFENVNGGWQMVGDVILGHAPIHFGSSVALSNDGLTVIIGAKKATNGFSGSIESGYFVVYEFVSTWTQKGDFNAFFQTSEGSGAYDAWGTSVAINGGGDVIAAAGVKSHSASLGETDSGMVVVYYYYNGFWYPLGSVLSNGLSSFSQYGFGLDLSDAGDTVAIGAPGDDLVEVWYMDYEIGADGDWVQLWETIVGAPNSQTGYNVRFDRDARLLVVSSISEMFESNANAGVVRAYFDDSSEWDLIGTFGGESENAYFGTGLDVNDDGLKIAIGAPGAEHGYVEVYEEDGSDWNLLTRQYGNASAYSDDAEYGFTVAMSGTNHIIVVGSVGTGAVHVHSFIENGSPCGEHGTCSDSYDAYICDCNAGWAGAQCDNVDECVVNACQNGATCVDGIDTYTCNCNPGWTGDYCADSIDDCGENLCENGTCVDGHETYTCNCNPGWTGHYCADSIDDCGENLCENGATCVDGHETYTCTCLDGWQGEYCGDSIDDCVTDNMCNFGDCVDEHMSTSCNCWPGYEDFYCSRNIVDDCADSPCKNSGTCTDGIDTYSCNCATSNVNSAGESGWTGPTCEVNVDECTLETDNCDTNANCVNTDGDFTCTCNTNYNGDGLNCTMIDCQIGSTSDDWTIDCVHGTATGKAGECKCDCVTGWQGNLCARPPELLSKWYDWTFALYLAFGAVVAFFAVYGTKTFTLEEKISRFFLNEKNKRKKMQHSNLRFIIIKS